MPHPDDALPSAMNDPAPPPVAGAIAAVAPPPFAYTTTRVLPEIGRRLLQDPQVARGERTPLSEVFKMLRNQVTRRMALEGHKLLAITSPRAVDGKSQVALNLALALAASYDTTVLLVDGDLSGRGLQHVLGLSGAAGLGEHLAGGAAIPGLLVNPGLARLVILPAGSRAMTDSAELLSTRAARELFVEMKSRYPDRLVIVDLPPALDTADTLAFLPQADTTLVVVEEHGSRIADVEALADLLAPFPLIGTVIDPRRAAR